MLPGEDEDVAAERRLVQSGALLHRAAQSPLRHPIAQ